MTPPDMTTSSGILTEIGSALTAVFGWLSNAVTFITSNPIIYVPMLISIGVAVTIGIVKLFVRG